MAIELAGFIAAGAAVVAAPTADPALGAADVCVLAAAVVPVFLATDFFAGAFFGALVFDAFFFAAMHETLAHIHGCRYATNLFTTL